MTQKEIIIKLTDEYKNAISSNWPQDDILENFGRQQLEGTHSLSGQAEI